MVHPRKLAKDNLDLIDLFICWAYEIVTNCSNAKGDNSQEMKTGAGAHLMLERG